MKNFEKEFKERFKYIIERDREELGEIDLDGIIGFIKEKIKEAEKEKRLNELKKEL